jgi:outer membrane autotransporter protein
MKKLLFSLVAAACCLSAAAQSDIFDNPNNEAYLGARIGLDITTPAGTYTNIDSYGNGAGFTIGAVYNIPVYKNLYVEPGLSIFYNSFSDKIYLDPSGMNELKGSIRNLGFRVPLVAGYFFDFTDDIRVAPFTGPQLNASIIARRHYDGLDSESCFGSNGFKHFDVQWLFGVGVTYQRYYVAISGGVGLTRCYSAADDRFRRNTFNIALGYNF